MTNYNLSLTIESIKTITRMFLDIFIMWMLLYYAIKIVKNNSRTIQIFKGIVLILIVDGIAKFLGLDTVSWLADMFVNWGFLAIIIVFQPEIRSVLEKLGKSNVFSRISSLSGNEKEKLVDELVTATMLLSRDQTGALISLEQSHSLSDYVKTGTPINSIVTAELITSIFVTSTPLHDGAVIIQGDRIACASAYFPPTNLDLPSRYGARHRAAIGISEVTDAVTIVISEETGGVSITEGGKIMTVNRKQLRDYLIRVICGEATEVKNTKTKAVVIPETKKVIVEKEYTQAIPSQEYIVDEPKKEEKPVVEEPKVEDKASRDTKFDTSVLSKLAIKRHATEEEQKEFVENNEEARVEEPVHIDELVHVEEPKEKKRFGLFGKKKSAQQKHSTKEIEAEKFAELDEEEASIKLPKKKERAIPSYPTQPNKQSSVEEEVIPVFQENIQIPREPIKQIIKEREPVIEKEEAKEISQEAKIIDEIIKAELAQHTSKISQTTNNKQFESTQSIRAMGVSNTTSQTNTNTSGLSGEEFRRARAEAIRHGQSLHDIKKQEQAMRHPVFDNDLEDLQSKTVNLSSQHSEHKPSFKEDFTDKSETANISLTGELKKPTTQNTITSNQFEMIDELLHLDSDDSLDDQFAMLDTMSLKKPIYFDIVDIKPAEGTNRSGGKQV